RCALSLPCPMPLVPARLLMSCLPGWGMACPRRRAACCLACGVSWPGCLITGGRRAGAMAWRRSWAWPARRWPPGRSRWPRSRSGPLTRPRRGWQGSACAVIRAAARGWCRARRRSAGRCPAWTPARWMSGWRPGWQPAPSPGPGWPARRGTVTGLDELHCQRAPPRYLVQDKGADYISTAVKDSQPRLFDAPDALPWQSVPVQHVMTDRAHGRDETRTIQVMPAPAGIFPHAARAFLIERHVADLSGSHISAIAALGITSLAPERAGPAGIAAHVRGHWGIENKLHQASETLRRFMTSRPRCGYGPGACWAWRQRLSC